LDQVGSSPLGSQYNGYFSHRQIAVSIIYSPSPSTVDPPFPPPSSRCVFLFRRGSFLPPPAPSFSCSSAESRDVFPILILDFLSGRVCFGCPRSFLCRLRSFSVSFFPNPPFGRQRRTSKLKQQVFSWLSAPPATC